MRHQSIECGWLAARRLRGVCARGCSPSWKREQGMTSEHRGATRIRNLGTPTFSKRLEQRLLRALEGTMAERTTRERERVTWIDRGRQRASGSLDASAPAPSSPRSTPAPGTRRLPADVQEQHPTGGGPRARRALGAAATASGRAAVTPLGAAPATGNSAELCIRHGARFCSVFSTVCNQFRPGRHALSAPNYRTVMRQRWREWDVVSETTAFAVAA